MFRHPDSLCAFALQLEEKARLEAEAREREVQQQQQLLEAQRRRQEEEEEALKQELLRLKEMQQLHTSTTNTSTSKKKKRENKPKETPIAVLKPETPSPSPAPTNNPQPLPLSAQNVLENMQNGKTQLLHGLVHLREPVKEPVKEVVPLPHAKIGPSSPRRGKEKPAEVLPSLPNGTLPHSEPCTARPKSKQQPSLTSRTNGEAGKRPLEAPQVTETPFKPPPPHAESKAKATRTAEEQFADTKKEERTNGKKQQNGVKEDRTSPVIEPPAVEQNGKAVSAESPQPKNKAKKNKKKKADKMNNSIGKHTQHYMLVIPQCLQHFP